MRATSSAPVVSLFSTVTVMLARGLAVALAVTVGVIVGITVLGGCAPAPQEKLRGANIHLPPPHGPSPRVHWRDGQLVTEHLPAIARAGSVVVLPVRDNDGGRGFPNLRIEVRDQRDHTLDTIAIMTPSEYEALVPDGATPSTELDRRIADANVKLSDLHTRNDLQALITLPATADVRARWDGANATLVVMRDGKRVAAVSGARWLPAPGPRCQTCPPCENEPFVKSMHGADGFDVVVVTIGFTGTDLCWEPSDQAHVVAW